MFSCQISHFYVNNYCKKSHDNLFKNYVIPEGGMSKDYVGLLEGEGGQGDPQKGLRNC